ncbi:MAG TPA: hypothetical protein VHO43_10735 [Ignavibacteriales bacterium]|nr:hypothetical protein [Ignavibacteriales bacterium]
MKDYANYTNWNPSKGDYIKSTLIEQRNLKKKSRRKLTLLSGTFIGILLLIVLIVALSKNTALFG